MADELNAGAAGQGDTGAAGDQGAAGAGVGDQGASTPAHWTETLPDDIRGNETLKGFKDVSELSTKYLEAVASIPKAPESVDGYVIDIPEGIQVDEGFVGAIKQGALEDGIPAEAFQKLASRYIAFQAKADADAKAEALREWEAKEVEWGAKGQEMIAAALKGAELIGGKSMGPMLIEGIKNKWLMPAWLDGFIRVGQAISDDTFEFGGQGGTPSAEYDLAGNRMLDYSKSMPKKT